MNCQVWNKMRTPWRSDPPLAIARRSVVSKSRALSQYTRNRNVAYALKKSTTFPAAIFTKLTLSLCGDLYRIISKSEENCRKYRKNFVLIMCVFQYTQFLQNPHIAEWPYVEISCTEFHQYRSTDVKNCEQEFIYWCLWVHRDSSHWAEFHKTRASSTTVLKNCSTELHKRFKMVCSVVILYLLYCSLPKIFQNYTFAVFTILFPRLYIWYINICKALR